MGRLTKDERLRVRDFVRHVVTWSGKSWDDLAHEAGVPFATAQGWRYGRATPEAPAFLAFLKAAGVLADDYTIKAAKPSDEEAVREEIEAAKQALGASRRPGPARRARDGQGKPS